MRKAWITHKIWISSPDHGPSGHADPGAEKGGRPGAGTGGAHLFRPPYQLVGPRGLPGGHDSPGIQGSADPRAALCHRETPGFRPRDLAEAARPGGGSGLYVFVGALAIRRAGTGLTGRLGPHGLGAEFPGIARPVAPPPAWPSYSSNPSLSTAGRTATGGWPRPNGRGTACSRSWQPSDRRRTFTSTPGRHPASPNSPRLILGPHGQGCEKGAA